MHQKKKIIKHIVIFSVIVIFLLSIGSNNLFADTKSQVSDFVTRFYQLCFDRNPDPEGLNYWVSQLTSKKATGAQFAENLIFSPEFTSKNTSNEKFITILYRAIFDREPDLSGLDNWLVILNSGYSRQFVLAGFVNSEEFNRLCNSYGITAGTIDPGKEIQTVQVANTQLPVVALHGIEPDPIGRYETSTGAFEFLLSTLKSYGYETINFTDLVNYVDKGTPLPAKPIIITSDDGYQSVYTYAFPILKKYGYKMTTFLITGYIGVDEESRRMNEFDFDKENIPHRPILIWPEIREMSRHGFEFQSHTWSHGIITNMPIGQAEMELAQSRNDIELNTGKPCFIVAWSHGIYNDKILALLSKTGYRGAASYSTGINELANLDLYNIRRVKIVAEIHPAGYAQVLELK